ncbi:MAG: AraC family transcriptional regulator [Candidatus Methylacidiphilales bacterium]|nr:AraC family transcriptional regulator [Candidatus Methylacidiphilales bacterium]
MVALPTNLSEKHIIGARSRENLAQGGRIEALRKRGIEWCGISHVAQPYQMVRKRPDFGHILGCQGGGGEIWFEGRWHAFREGMIFLNPPGHSEAMRAVAGRRWEFCWVHLQADHFPHPESQHWKPRIFRLDPRPLRTAVEGLLLAQNILPEMPGIDHWAELILLYSHRLIQGERSDVRLWKLWEAVGKDPGRDWSIQELGQMAHLSREHLRRICVKETGRTPMQQVTSIRMQRAAALLQYSDQSIEAIAHAMGYENPFTFSNSFQRWMGSRPSIYRQAQKQDSDPGPMRPSTVLGKFSLSQRLPKSRWHCLNLATWANRAVSTGTTGWFGDEHRLPLVPGRHVFHGVPFDLMQELPPQPRAMVLFRSTHPHITACVGAGLPLGIDIPIRTRVRAAYFLHAAGWVEGGEPFGRYRMVPVRGRESEILIRALGESRPSPSSPANIQDWWWGFEPVETKSTRSVYVGDPAGSPGKSGRIYVHEWVNPDPSVPLQEIRITVPGTTRSTLALLGLTLALY